MLLGFGVLAFLLPLWVFMRVRGLTTDDEEGREGRDTAESHLSVWSGRRLVFQKLQRSSEDIESQLIVASQNLARAAECQSDVCRRRDGRHLATIA